MTQNSRPDPYRQIQPAAGSNADSRLEQRYVQIRRSKTKELFQTALAREEAKPAARPPGPRALPEARPPKQLPAPKDGK